MRRIGLPLGEPGKPVPGYGRGESVNRRRNRRNRPDDH